MRSIALILLLSLSQSLQVFAQSVGDFSIPYNANATGPATEKHFAGGVSKLWGTTDAGAPVSITLGTGLSLSSNTLTISGVPWSVLTSTPTTLSGYGITDGLVTTNNLSDLASATTARSNLGLGAAALLGTSTTGSAGAVAVYGLFGSLSAVGSITASAALGSNTGAITGNGFTFFDGTYSLTVGRASLTANRQIDFPNVAGTLITTGDTGTVTNTMLAGSIALSKLSITGTPNGTKYLRDDGTWQAISSGLTIGSTAITGGTSGRLLTSGTTVGELTLGTGVSTWLGTPTLANLNSAVSDADLAAIGSANQFASAQRIGSASGDYLAIGSSATRELRLSSNAFSLGTASWLLGQYDSGTLVSSASSTVFWEMTVAIRGNAIFYGDLTWNSSNLRIAREGNYHAFLREGTNANRWSVANTYTSATNYEAFVIDWQTTANTARIGTVKGSGGGTARQMIIQTNGTERIRISATGEIFMTLPTSAGTTGSLWNDSGTVKVAP